MGDLRAKVDALLVRGDLTPEQAVAFEEMRAGLDVQSPELLALGHREVVLDYFDLCAGFWDRAELRAWRAAIAGGMAPHFGYHALR